MTPSTHTTAPIQAASYTLTPEFVDSKGLRLGFGISRSLGYELAARGLVRTVALRKNGATRAKRLWVVADLRAFLLANIDQRKKQAPDAPIAQAPIKEPVSANRSHQGREATARQAIGAMKQQRRH